tara:strand:- start:2627 stop:4468 length:1842 start_codon:yes stop_codon:yes gene_type:complete
MKNTKLFSFLGIFVFLILGLSLVSATTLAEWDFEDSNLVKDSGVATATLSINAGGTATYPAGNAPTATTALSSDDWDASEYFEIVIDTTDYESLSIEFDEQTSTTGPTSFKIEYSSDGAAFTDLAGSTTVTTTPFTANPMHTFDLSSISAIDDNALTKLKITPSGATNAAGTLRIDNLKIEGTLITTSFCTDGPQDEGELTLNVDVKNKGAGEEDDEWLPLDKIEVEVEVENDGGEDLDNVILELGLFEEGSSTNIADEMVWISEDDEEIKIGDVDEDDQEKHTFIFKVDPEIEKGNYILKVKAYPKSDEDIKCIDYSDDLEDFGSEDTYAEISIDREDVNDERAIIVDMDELNIPYEVNCGQTIIAVADIYNIADEDQDQVKVTLVNSELEINLAKEIKEDLDMGDKEEVTFTIEIPENAEEKEYVLEFRTRYDYDDDDGSYDEFSDAFTKHIKVVGSCQGTEPTLVATLLSDAKLGEDLVIQVTVTNNGKSSENFVIAAESTETWAEIINVNPQILTIAQDSVGTATITLNPTQAGTQTFDIALIYSGQEVRQSVSVIIEEETGFMTGAFSGFSELGDTGLYAIAGIFLVLVIIILVLIVKVAKASKVAEF